VILGHNGRDQILELAITITITAWDHDHFFREVEPDRTPITTGITGIKRNRRSLSRDERKTTPLAAMGLVSIFSDTQ